MRLILLAACWLILTDGDPDGWLFGLAVILPVAYAWHRFFPPTGFRIRALQIPLFAGWFAGQSLLAGLDVARRLVLPALPVQPGVMHIVVGLPEGSPRWLLANILSLLPGTLSVTLQGAGLELHCLDTRDDNLSGVRRAEARVAALFGVPVATPATEACRV